MPVEILTATKTVNALDGMRDGLVAEATAEFPDDNPVKIMLSAMFGWWVSNALTVWEPDYIIELLATVFSARGVKLQLKGRIIDQRPDKVAADTLDLSVDGTVH